MHTTYIIDHIIIIYLTSFSLKFKARSSFPSSDFSTILYSRIYEPAQAQLI